MPKRWTREELLLALNLYHQTPFGRQHAKHPPIIELAQRLGRTPGSIAMKLSNFTYLDPAEGGKGLSGASQLDRSIWDEFYQRHEALADESEPLIENPTITTLKESFQPAGDSETTANVKVRRHQKFFRKAVLGSYGGVCCISGNPVRKLLRASHIIPWRDSIEHRADPCNGLCLAASYDAAFDVGLITIDDSFKMLVSEKLKEYRDNHEISTVFLAREHKAIILPEKNRPNPEFLQWHRDHRFLA
ncbi:MAG: HNH endonuclease [Verrucomicrobiales bacterium]